MWNVTLYKKILRGIKDSGIFKGQEVSTLGEIYRILATEIGVEPETIESWARPKSNGPGDQYSVGKLKELLGVDCKKNDKKEWEVPIMRNNYSDFVKENIQKAYNLMIDFLETEETEDEAVYCAMRTEMCKLQIAIPKEIYEKIEECANTCLEPMVTDHAKVFASLYAEELGAFDEDGIFHLKDEDATLKHMCLYIEKMYEIRSKIEEFGMNELYPILVS